LEKHAARRHRDGPTRHVLGERVHDALVQDVEFALHDVEQAARRGGHGIGHTVRRGAELHHARVTAERRPRREPGVVAPEGLGPVVPLQELDARPLQTLQRGRERSRRIACRHLRPHRTARAQESSEAGLRFAVGGRGVERRDPERERALDER